MKKIKQTLLVGTLAFSTFLGGLALASVPQTEKANAEVKIPSSFVTTSETATFAYQKLPEPYNKLVVYNSQELTSNKVGEVDVNGAMVFSAFNADSSSKINASMTFSTVLSAERLTKDLNLFEYAVITDEIMPQRDDNSNAPPFDSISLTLASKDNPQNYIKISNIPNPYANYVGLVRGSTADMQAAGKGKTDSFYDNFGYNYGSGVKGSLSGCYYAASGKLNKRYSVSYKLDTQSMTAYAYPMDNGDDIKDILVRDFDNPSHMIGVDEVFKGFETDELSATLTVEGLVGKVQIAVLNFNGVKLYGDNAEEIADNTGPEVFATNYAEGVEAEVGSAFPVFQFKSFDAVDGLAGIDEYKVYFDYTGAKQEILTNEGVFIPQQKGLYTIVAEKTDSSGNIGRAIYTVEAKEKLSAFKISLAKAIPTSGTVGTRITLPEATVSGGTVGTNYVTSVWYGNKQIELDEFNGFTFEYQGLYTIKYSVFDYRNVAYDFNYYIQTQLDKKPIVEFPNIPNYVAVGHTIKLPQLKALDWYSYAGIPVEAKVSVTLQKEGEAKREIGNEYTFTEEGSYIYTIKAQAVRGSEYVSKSYSIQAIQAGLVSDYFVKENVEIVFAENMIFKANQEEAKLSFISDLYVDTFSLNFNIPKEYKNFERLSITFTDKYAMEEQVTVDCRDGYIDFCGKSIKVNSGFGGLDFALSFKGFTLRNFADELSNISQYDNGNAFRGFSSGCVYMSFTFYGVSGTENAGFEIKSMGNHSYFVSDATDISAPVINIAEEIPSIIKIGEILRLPKITAYDVFEGEKNVKITLLRNGKALPLTKDNTFLINNFGTYVLRLEATDSTNHTTVINKNIYCHNYIAPTITVENEIQSTAKMGEKIQLSWATAVDYFGNEVEVRIFVQKRGGAYVTVNENNQFVAEEETEYIVWYTATDSEYNTAIVKFIIKV